MTMFAPRSIPYRRLYQACLLAGLLLMPPVQARDVYRSVVPDGGVEYSDRAAPGAQRIVIQVADAPLREVVRVLDGDTLELKGGERIRLIGINAPELARRDQPAEPGAVDAWQFLAKKLVQQRVKIEPGAEPRDKYGRLLAHVFDEQGVNINELLLHEGHAHIAPHPPNTKNAEQYLAAETQARLARRGIWSLDQYQVTSARGVDRYRNSFRLLDAVIGPVHKGNRYVRVDLGEKLMAFVPLDQLPRFARAGKAPQQLQGQRVLVGGWVGTKRGVAVIHLRDPSQIQLR